MPDLKCRLTIFYLLSLNLYKCSNHLHWGLHQTENNLINYLNSNPDFFDHQDLSTFVVYPKQNLDAFELMNDEDMVLYQLDRFIEECNFEMAAYLQDMREQGFEGNERGFYWKPFV